MKNNSIGQNPYKFRADFIREHAVNRTPHHNVHSMLLKHKVFIHSSHSEKFVLSVLMAGLDSVSGLDNLGNLIPPCAPEDLSNRRYI